VSDQASFSIAVMPGDGIGPEVIEPSLELLQQVERSLGGFKLQFEELPAGAGCYRDNGEALPAASVAKARAADAIFLGAMGLPDIRYPDGTEIVPQIDLRDHLGLYGGVRPVRCVPGLPLPLADPRAQKLDFVLVRESTEGLFAARGKTQFEADRARDVLEITRAVSERLFHFSFELARRRKASGHRGHVTLVDKANVVGAFAFFREIFDEVAEAYPEIETSRAYVDATAMNLVTRPWIYDVLVTENMFGDILSDLGAGLMGGLGMAPSADIGDAHAVFQPCHGTAPDIAGSGKANPTATILSAAMMLDWLGHRGGTAACITAAHVLAVAVERAFAGGRLLPFEFGGTDGTEAIAKAVAHEIEAAAEAAGVA
jgi:3-isopropylmalate dehydrogenase